MEPLNVSFIMNIWRDLFLSYRGLGDWAKQSVVTMYVEKDYINSCQTDLKDKDEQNEEGLNKVGLRQQVYVCHQLREEANFKRPKVLLGSSVIYFVR